MMPNFSVAQVNSFAFGVLIDFIYNSAQIKNVRLMLKLAKITKNIFNVVFHDQNLSGQSKYSVVVTKTIVMKI